MKVLIADPIAQAGIDLFESNDIQVDIKTGLSQNELVAIIDQYDGIVVRSETEVTKDVLDAGINLQVVGRAGVGVDNIDIVKATEKGIVVVNAPSSNTIAAAEHTMALILSLARHVPQAHSTMVQNLWERRQFMGRELKGKRLGLIGLGRIGTEVARRALAFDVEIVAFDPFVAEDHANKIRVQIVTFEELLRTSDIISLHTPLRKDGEFLIGKMELEMMKKGSYLINCARGGLVDESAALQALHDEALGGVALDVFVNEPPAPNKLRDHPNLVLTPHLGASTSEAQTGVATQVVQQMLDVIQGRTPAYAINAPLIPADTVKEISPFIPVAFSVGRLVSQLLAGQPASLEITFSGDIARFDTSILTANAIRGFLEQSTDEKINVINANIKAQQHGLKITETKHEELEDSYSSLITVETKSNTGSSVVKGSLTNNEVHIVQIGSYRVDIVPSGKPWIMINHTDRPGMIGNIGTVTGSIGINIASMQVSREKSMGPAMTVLGLDKAIEEKELDNIRNIDDVDDVRVAHI